MTHAQELPETQQTHNWQKLMTAWAYAYGQPVCSGAIKQNPEDFIVIENMQIEATGEGEHCWLHITKTRQNTEQVAKSLARFANVTYRDVGYSGMKDLFAVTQQWFSVWLPKTPEPNWAEFEMLGVEINAVVRHNRKIKRGSHTSNYFEIKVRELSGNLEELDTRLEKIKNQGVPNYFGEQRFGRQCNNMVLASDHLIDRKPIKNRSLKSITLSAARSWLFNEILSARIKNNTWQSLHKGEAANLDGTGSVFNVSDDECGSDEIASRLATLDIHPTAPMWGIKDRVDAVTPELTEFEEKTLRHYEALKTGLERVQVKYQRRPLRLRVQDLEWQYEDDLLTLRFSLRRGQFATSVLREVVRES